MPETTTMPPDRETNYYRFLQLAVFSEHGDNLADDEAHLPWCQARPAHGRAGRLGGDCVNHPYPVRSDYTREGGVKSRGFISVVWLTVKVDA